MVALAGRGARVGCKLGRRMPENTGTALQIGLTREPRPAADGYFLQEEMENGGERNADT